MSAPGEERECDATALETTGAGRYRVRLTDNTPGWERGEILDGDDRVIGKARAYPSGGRAMCLQGTPFEGVVPFSQMDFTS